MIEPSHPSEPSRRAPSVDAEATRKEAAARREDYLCLAADFDNYKKRSQRDFDRRAAAEKESFIDELLPVLDNLERALACGKPVSSQALWQGVEMTLQQLVRLLRRHGIEAVEEAGRPFDPHRHEAVSTRRDPGQPDHIVLEVIQRGYSLGAKLVRPAKVIVNDLTTIPGTRRAS